MMTIKWILLIAVFKYSSGIHPEQTTRTSDSNLRPLSVSTNNCGSNRRCIRFMDCNDLYKENSNLYDSNNDQDADPPCPYFTDVCCTNITTQPIQESLDHKPIKCGVLNPNGVGRKIKEPIDSEAQFGEFPWMVAVIKKVNESDVYHCGGSLIHSSVVLTTIQGTVGEDHNSLIARAGEWDTQTNRESFPFVESNVASIVRHEKYNKWKRINNIALLFLETPIERSKHINTICLPPPNMNFDSSRCFVTGFGQDKFGDEGTHQPILKKIEMLVVEKQRCQEMFRKTRLGQTFELHESVICAGGEAGKDVCTGDGGSPLVCPVPGNEGQYYQAGIVSWGIGCGKANVPGAYTNVAFFADWISKQL